MSFDFNLSSDDDSGDEADTLLGGILQNTEHANETIQKVDSEFSQNKTAASNASDDDSIGSKEEDPFDDGYDDYYGFDDEEEDRRPSSLTASSLASVAAFPSDFDDPEEKKDEIGVVFGIEEEEDEVDGDDEEDEIDWEDAAEEPEEVNGNSPTPGLVTPRAVTIDLNKAENQSKAQNPKKRKRIRSVAVYKHDRLSGNPELQFLLTELHKSSLLAWASHVACLSGYASREECLGLAHSLVPTAWLWKEGDKESAKNHPSSSMVIPTVDDIGHFLRWFVQYTGASSAGASFPIANGPNSTSRPSVTPTGKRIRAPAHHHLRRRKPTTSVKRKNGKSNAAKVDGYNMNSNNGFVNYRLSEYCLYLSNTHRNQSTSLARRATAGPVSDTPSFNEYDALVLFLSMVRSLGWRARYVVALEPISRDLDVDHPLFSNESSGEGILARFFQRVVASGIGNQNTPIAIDEDGIEDSKPPARKQYPSSLYSHNILSNGVPKHVCWVEVLCKSTDSRVSDDTESTPRMQWMHVDPMTGITNRPSSVEEALFVRNKERGGGRKKGNSSPISYALAAEHLPSSLPSRRKNSGSISNSDDLVVKMTDVTRRYASSMIETMKARGIAQKRPSSKPKKRRMARVTWARMEEERPDQWFSKLLDAISKRNQLDPNRRKPPPPSARAKREALKSRGKSRNDAIALDDDGESDLDKKPAAVEKRNIEVDIGNIDNEEESQLRESASQEPLPTSKAAFQKHPLYVIRSVLNSTEVLKPGANKRMCGMFKGELVFRRSDVETALSAKRWLYEGRKVRESELSSPVKKVKARKPPTPKGFRALSGYGVGTSNDGTEESRARQIAEATAPLGDGKESLYGSWQTDPWRPTPVNPGDPIPVNEHNNVELELLNPGLVHVHLHHVAKVAKKLGLPYAPCLVGFEGSGRPTIRGIVVHETNEELLREAHAGMADHLMREENEKREKAILLRWKRILVGVLTKDRLEREYGDPSDKSDDDDSDK